MTSLITAEEIAALFTRSDGSFRFARWGRPIAPVVLGVDDATLATVKGAFEAVVVLADHRMAEADPELGANAMMFFVREWEELLETPHLQRLVPEIEALVARLSEAGANQYRVFRFEEGGAIMACLIFLRMDAELREVPADTLALSQVVQSILLWSDTAFLGASPLAAVPDSGTTILRPAIADLIRAAYDPVLPDAAADPSHALRLHARLPRPQ